MFYGAGHPDRWPILLALTAVPCLVSLIILPFMPESPRYLLVNKDNREAAEEGKVESILSELKGHIIILLQ